MHESYAALCSWRCEEILLHRGSQFVKGHAIATSTHEFTVATNLLANMAPLTNGAVINIFADTDTPLNVVAVQVGYPQERKSQNTKLTKDIGTALDQHVLATAKDIAVEGGEAPEKLQMASACMASFTPTVFCERCSGDYVISAIARISKIRN